MSLPCPSEAELVLFVLARPIPVDGGVASHVHACSACEHTVAELRTVVDGLLASNDADAIATPACLDDDALADAAGARDGPVSQPTLAHLAGCPRCRARLAAALALLADPAVAAEVRRLEDDARHLPARAKPRVVLGGIGVLAAAAVTLLIVQPARRAADAPTHRGPTITAAAAPTLVAPVGDVAVAAAARTLRWTAVDGATRYRVTLFEASGQVRYETLLADTALVLPDSVVVEPGRSYLWKVEARTTWERWTASELVEFRVLDTERSGAAIAPASMFHLAARVAAAGPRQPDSLRLLVDRLSDAALAREARRRPLELREALTATLARAVGGAPATRAAELATARRLAAAYGSAWRDPFLVREVERFAAWTPAQRASKVWGDSVRRAGITAFARDGPAAAIVHWRRALARLRTIADTAGIAAAIGNIGAAQARLGRLDSAERALDGARALAAAVGDIRVDANAVGELAGLREARDDLVGARVHYATAMALRGRIGDTRGLAADHNNLAGLAQAAGDLDEARRQLEAALAINRRDGRTTVAATNVMNLAQLASLTGDFARADALYGEALATWRAARQWADVADAERGLGDLELRRGDYPAARAHLLAALAVFDRTGPLADALDVRRALAGARAAEGDLQRALDELRQAQGLADSGGAPPTARARITLARADLAAQLNAHGQAERLFASAQALFRSAGDRPGEAAAQQGRGGLLLAQDDLIGAQRSFAGALRTQVAGGDPRGAAVTRLSLGALSLQRGDTAAARAQLARASAELARAGDPVGAAAALGERAALERGAGLPALADSLYRAALASVGGRVAPAVTWGLHAGLGAVRQTRGTGDAAAHELRAAIADIERSGRALVLPERRSGFLADKWDVYARLALVERARGRVADAFVVSERLHAGEMLDVLAAGRIAAPRDTAAELVAREQDLRWRIAELTRALEGSAGPDDRSARGRNVTGVGAVTREGLLRAQESYAELLLDIRERAPRHAALVSRETSGWRDVARRLVPDEAFVEYLVGDESTIAFVVTRDTIVGVDLSVGRRDLARLVDFARGTLQPLGGGGARGARTRSGGHRCASCTAISSRRSRRRDCSEAYDASRSCRTPNCTTCRSPRSSTTAARGDSSCSATS